MTWYYKGKEITTIPAEFAGFVYLITNNLNGRKYVGKKLAVKKVTKQPLKGKTRKRVEYKESDWKDYYGSSTELLQDIANYGTEHFTREIIHLCRTKGELNYKELTEQVHRKVLETNDYYNNLIDVKIHGNHVPKN